MHPEITRRFRALATLAQQQCRVRIFFLDQAHHIFETALMIGCLNEILRVDVDGDLCSKPQLTHSLQNSKPFFVSRRPLHE